MAWAKLAREVAVPAASVSRIRKALPRGWSVRVKGNACIVARALPVDLYNMIGRDSRPVRGQDTFAHRFEFTLLFRPMLSVAAHRRLAEKMAQRWRRLTRWQHGVASSGMGGLCFRKEAPISRIQAYKRLAHSIELVPTLYDSTHSVHVRVSTDAGHWAYFDRAVRQEVAATRRLLEGLYERYPTIPNAPTR